MRKLGLERGDQTNSYKFFKKFCHLQGTIKQKIKQYFFSKYIFDVSFVISINLLSD